MQAPPIPDIIETARLDVAEKYAKHLLAEVTLARHDDGFFDKKYWADFVSTKVQWQRSANDFYTLLHELAK